MGGRNRTDYELQQMIATLPVGVRSQMYEILQEIASGSTQRAFSASTINGLTLSATELGYIDGVTAGSALAGKALVASANVDISGLRNIGLTGKLVMPTNTAVATAGAATLAKTVGKITSEGLTTAAQADYTLTVANTAVAAADYAFASVANGTNTTGTPVVSAVVTAANTLTIKINNAHASQAFNGTLVISFLVIPVT